MQVDPRLGILQSLVIGMPSTSAFARIFQFGMRLGMRSYTIGSAWWQGDCGPYWGHNAIVRLAPFMAHCELPVLDRRRAGERPCAQPRPGRGGADAARAATRCACWRRKARASSRTRRRWSNSSAATCAGARATCSIGIFCGCRACSPVSRYQLVFAMLMFLGSPAWIGLLLIGTPAGRAGPDAGRFHAMAMRASPCSSSCW